MTQTDFDPLDLTGQEQSSELTAEEQRLAREKELNDLRWVMSTKQGRRFMWRLLSSAGIYRMSFSTDPLVMAFNEGARNAGLRQLNDIMEACPERNAEMLEDQRKEANASGSQHRRTAKRK